MSKKEKKFLLSIILVAFIPIFLNEIKEYNLKKLKQETLEISETLKNEYNQITQINISKNKYVKNKVKTRGSGKAFVNGDNVTVILSYKGYCSVKVPEIQEVALSKSQCQNLELINNTIIPIVKKDGLVKVDNEYYYKGENVDNYIIFNDEYYRIFSFEKNQIKIIKNEPITQANKYEYLQYLNNDYYAKVDNSLIDTMYIDLNKISIDKNINIVEENKKSVNISILSLNEYLGTLNEKCKIKNNNLICGKSFASKNMWLSNVSNDKSYYVYNDGNIYIDSNEEYKHIYPVITLKENVIIISGTGTKSDPYHIMKN